MVRQLLISMSTLDADGVFSSSALIGESLDATSVTTIGTNFDDPGLIA